MGEQELIAVRLRVALLCALMGAGDFGRWSASSEATLKLLRRVFVIFWICGEVVAGTVDTVVIAILNGVTVIPGFSIKFISCTGSFYFLQENIIF